MGGGSFQARSIALTGASIFYTKRVENNIYGSLPYIMNDLGYNTIALEEAGVTYNLDNFLPKVGFKNVYFDIGAGKLYEKIAYELSNKNNLMFLYGFTFLGHTGAEIYIDEPPFNADDYIKNFLSFFNKENVKHLLDNIYMSVALSKEIIKIRDEIIKVSPNALIVIKRDHTYPYLLQIIPPSSIEIKIKNAFLNDYNPGPVLVWDGTNGAYRMPYPFAAENIPLFIAANVGGNYQNKLISLLYKDRIGDIYRTYNEIYEVKNNSFDISRISDKDLDNKKILEYEDAYNTLINDVFHGNQFFYKK